jgi:putative transposase
MPRTARLVVPDVPLHIVQRGHDRSACFFRPADYRTYLRYLKTFSQRHGCTIHAYCLMTNHVHLLLSPSDTRGCGLLMKNLGQCYVQTVNMALDRSGTLWEGRFHSCLVPSAHYVLACHRYIELNPVRAGIVARAHDYPWSSFAANGLGNDDALVSLHPTVAALGRHAYRSLFDVPLPTQVVEEIRAATRGGHRLGVPRRGRGRAPKESEMGSVPIKEEA